MSKCRGGCGFFGSEANKGYCSSCFKNLPNKEELNNDDFDQWKKNHNEQVKKIEEENVKRRMEDEEYNNPTKKKKQVVVKEKKWPPLSAEAKSILETEFIFSNISQYLTPVGVSNFMQTCKSFHKVGGEETVWKNLYKTKYGKNALETFVGKESVCSIWQEQVREIRTVDSYNFSLADFEKKSYLLEACLFQKVSVLAPLHNVNSPWSYLKDTLEVSKIIETIWQPVATDMPDLIEFLQENVKLLYVVREKYEDERWYLLYIFKEDGNLKFFSAEPPLKNSEEFEVEGWGIIPTSLAQFYRVHNGITTFGGRLDSWESGIFRSDFLNIMESGEDEQLQVLQFNNDGAGNGQSFIRETDDTEKDPLTGDFDHENPFEIHPEIPFYEFVEELIVREEE